MTAQSYTPYEEEKKTSQEIKEDLLKYYKHVKKCKWCRRIYGLDLDDHISLCPKCEYKFKQKKKNSEDGK